MHSNTEAYSLAILGLSLSVERARDCGNIQKTAADRTHLQEMARKLFVILDERANHRYDAVLKYDRDKAFWKKWNAEKVLLPDWEPDEEDEDEDGA